MKIEEIFSGAIIYTECHIMYTGIVYHIIVFDKYGTILQNQLL